MPLAQTINLEQLSEYFHLPINDVAKELGVCATVLKKICRRNGIPRWPHRKIKSLDKMIRTLEATVAKKPEDEERIRQEIATLYNKKLFLMKNPNVLVKANKAAGKYKGPVLKPQAISSSSSSEERAWDSLRYMPGSAPQLHSNNAFSSGSEEEAANSLLGVFASLQHKLQDQVPSTLPAPSSHTSTEQPATPFTISSIVSPPSTLSSLQLPPLPPLPEDQVLVLPEKRKLATLEPEISLQSVLPTTTPSRDTTNNTSAMPPPSLPSWFFQERERYANTEAMAFGNFLPAPTTLNRSPLEPSPGGAFRPLREPSSLLLPPSPYTPSPAQPTTALSSQDQHNALMFLLSLNNAQLPRS